MSKHQNKRKQKASHKVTGNSKESEDKKPDCICLSRQLIIKRQAKVKMRNTPGPRRLKRNTVPKPNEARESMPTFTDLEKMFGDSETETEVSNPESSTSNTSTNLPQINDNTLLAENISTSNSDQYYQNIVSSNDIQSTAGNTDEASIKQDVLKTENMIEQIDLVCSRPDFKCDDVIVIDDDEPDIVLEHGRKRNLSQIDDEIKLDNLNEGQPQKVRKLSNANCNIIECDNDSIDSDVTVIYDIESSLNKASTSDPSPLKRFSPLPSTSTNDAVILENDKTFMQSLSELASSSTNEPPSGQDSEISIIDDDISNQNSSVVNNTTDSDLDPQSQSNKSNIMKQIDINALLVENGKILSKHQTIEKLSAVFNVRPVETKNQTLNTGSQDLSIIEDKNESNIIAPQKSLNIQPKAPVVHKTRPDLLIQLINAPPRNSNLPPTSTLTMLVESPLQSSHNSASLNCPICLESLRCTESASTTCGHIFCMACIKRALKSAKRCPTCRKGLKGIGYHRLFL